MQFLFPNGITSVVLRMKITDSTSASGAGLTGLTSATSGLSISTIADNEAAATVYTVAGTTIETISTLGTFAAPTATKCRFKEVDATNNPGLYEFQFANARYAVSGARSIEICAKGATNMIQLDSVVQLTTSTSLPGVDLQTIKSQTVTAAAGVTFPATIASLTQAQVTGGAYALATDSSGRMSLQATGLDAIPTTAPSGVASNFREMLVQTWRRLFKKAILDTGATTLKTYADDGTTVLTTQTVTTVAGVETQGTSS